MKKIYVESLGCAKNQVDSEILLSYARDEGYERVEDPTEADIIFVNSCGFIDSAKSEAIETFFSLKELNPNAKVIMGGCLAQRFGKEMELGEAAAIFGNHDLSQFPKLLKEIEEDKRENIVSIPEYPDPDRERDSRYELLSYPRSAYLKISEGCGHRCSYCAIPLIRGPLRSRPFERVIEEAERLIKSGVYEICIIAQDLAAYGLDLYGESRFVELMDRLSSLEGDFVLRMLYIHPDFFPFTLLPLMKERDKILPYFDIPMQHADPSILKAMRRFGDVDTYVGLVNRIREAIPDAVIRTTLMVGFPGEDRRAFNKALELVKRAEFDWMGAFVYSREEDTPAFDMRSEEAHQANLKKAERWKNELERAQTPISERRLERFIGRELKALIEEKIEGEELALGRIYSQAPEVDGLTVIMGRDMEPGDVVTVGITNVRGFDLEAVKVER